MIFSGFGASLKGNDACVDERMRMVVPGTMTVNPTKAGNSEIEAIGA